MSPTPLPGEADRDTLGRFVADARRRGAVSVKLYQRHPALLPHLRLGGAGELPRRWIALRRLALSLRLPPRLLAVGARLGPSEARASRWLAFLYSYCYMRGVRDAVDEETWRRLPAGYGDPHVPRRRPGGRGGEPLGAAEETLRAPTGLASPPPVRRDQLRRVRSRTARASLAAGEVSRARLRRRFRRRSRGRPARSRALQLSCHGLHGQRRRSDCRSGFGQESWWAALCFRWPRLGA